MKIKEIKQGQVYWYKNIYKETTDNDDPSTLAKDRPCIILKVFRGYHNREKVTIVPLLTGDSTHNKYQIIVGINKESYSIADIPSIITIDSNRLMGYETYICKDIMHIVRKKASDYMLDELSEVIEPKNIYNARYRLIYITKIKQNKCWFNEVKLKNIDELKDLDVVVGKIEDKYLSIEINKELFTDTSIITDLYMDLNESTVSKIERRTREYRKKKK